ncbi:MAG: hypothetical protein BWY74_01660 [Firmicutes bacterium ADurb.Bin419]|nr:MAG: hypothetical protein BWY74_01660 [Firmicutes bacterium ADurb.Bin419]
MSKGTRDALILTIIGLVLYGLIYYNFVLIDAMAKVNDVNSQIEAVEKEKQALENDLKNLPNLKKSLEMKNVQNERLEEYLMNEANLADNIEYVDKLAKLFNSSFGNVRVGTPLASSTDGTNSKYYEFAIEADTLMNYNDAMNLINYIEGGTRKVKVTVFKLAPSAPASVNSTTGQNTQPEQTQTNTETKYAINMVINMYSLNLSNIDEVYEYSRKRFNRFNDGDGVIFVPATVSAGTNTNVGANGSSGTNGSVGANGTISSNTNYIPNDVIEQNIAKGNDIEMRVISFLYGGQNFRVNGAGARAPIKLKVKDRLSVKITFSGNSYNVDVVDGLGKKHNVNGQSSNDAFRMSVLADFPLDIKENQNLGADIQIINNSSKRVDIKLEDKVSRIKITDRDGNVIYNQSGSEKVYII